MKHKGGEVYGSIYERRRENGGKSYTAEIQFQGHKVRRSSKNRRLLELWMNDICIKLNEATSEYRSKLELEIMKVKKELYNQLLNRVGPILLEARKYDLRHEECARENGIKKQEHFQTYLMLDDEERLIKIGKSHDIYTRMSVIGKRTLSLIAYADTDVEKELHKLYRQKRIKGEWFRLNKDDIDEIIKTYGFKTPGVCFRTRGWLL